MNQKKQRNNFIIFYIIIAYVFAFIFWWTYLLYDKTAQHYNDVLEYQLLKHEVENNNTDFKSTEEFLSLENEFQRHKTMVITEGAVFFLILLFGMLRMRKSILKEIQIARQQKNFILSITHELKSPLSSIKLMNETILKRDLPKPKQDELLQNSLAEVDRLNGLVENILLAAKIENDSYGFSKQDMNISSLLEEITTRFQIAKKGEIKADIDPAIILKGDRAAVTSIFVNLIENALKYGGENPRVLISLKKEADKIMLRVADNGIGIVDEEKKKVFDKFYRVGNEETRRAKGTGLGLYIVYKLVKYHKGKIAILDNEPKGTIFQLVF